MKVIGYWTDFINVRLCGKNVLTLSYLYGRR